ncbi:MAG: Gldg family protein [Limisphaerales bacterium]
MCWTLRPGTGEQAGTRTIVLLLVVCLLGIAGGAFWFYRASQRSPAGANGQAGSIPASLLSDSTRATLGRLESPLEIRFYALLDPATLPDSVTAFAGRVGQLLSAYQQEAGGKIKVTSVTSQSNPNANAAMADGIIAFNRDRGEACYLGITLVLNGRKETLPHLSPEWEQALEPDVTRAIIRLVDATGSVTLPAVVSQINTAAIQEVRALIPDLAAVSVPAGKQILQDAAYKEFTAAAKEMQTQVKEAEQHLTQAQNGGTDAERQAALQHLHQIQAEQAEKLKAIAARSKAQIDTFQQLKAAPH